VTSLKLKSPPF